MLENLSKTLVAISKLQNKPADMEAAVRARMLRFFNGSESNFIVAKLAEVPDDGVGGGAPVPVDDTFQVPSKQLGRVSVLEFFARNRLGFATLLGAKHASVQLLKHMHGVVAAAKVASPAPPPGLGLSFGAGVAAPAITPPVGSWTGTRRMLVD